MNYPYRLMLKPDDPTCELRFPADLYYDILKSAEEKGRSFNTELLLRLSRSLKYDRDVFILST